jgi:hypothetical protein
MKVIRSLQSPLAGERFIPVPPLPAEENVPVSRQCAMLGPPHAEPPSENRPDTWLRPNASQNVRFLLHRGRHTWPLTTPRPLMAYSRVRAEADIDRFWHALHILRLTPSGYAALNDGGYILAVRIGKLWVLPIAG